MAWIWNQFVSEWYKLNFTLYIDILIIKSIKLSNDVTCFLSCLMISFRLTIKWKTITWWIVCLVHVVHSHILKVKNFEKIFVMLLLWRLMRWFKSHLFEGLILVWMEQPLSHEAMVTFNYCNTLVILTHFCQ